KLGNKVCFGSSKCRAASLANFKRGAPEPIRSGQTKACAIGVLISWLPSCANTEPSTYSTMNCTTLSGCTSTSTCSCCTANNQQASISSRPLFIKLAESTEIFCPIDQLGCLTAMAGVTVANCSAEK